MTIFCHIVTKPLPDWMNNASRTHSAYALNLVEDASQKGYDLLQGLNISRQELHAWETMSIEAFRDHTACIDIAGPDGRTVRAIMMRKRDSDFHALADQFKQ